MQKSNPLIAVIFAGPRQGHRDAEEDGPPSPLDTSWTSTHLISWAPSIRSLWQSSLHMTRKSEAGLSLHSEPYPPPLHYLWILCLTFVGN